MPYQPHSGSLSKFDRWFRKSRALPTAGNDRFQAILPRVGYALLWLTIVDFAGTFLTLNIHDPQSRIEAIVHGSDHIFLPLVAAICIFSPRYFPLSRFQIQLLKLTSWMMGCLGCTYLLLAPILIISTSQIQWNSVDQIDIQQLQNQQTLQNLEHQLQAPSTGWLK